MKTKTDKKSAQPQVAVVMGSKSDWPVMKTAADILDDFGVGHQLEVISAHRTMDVCLKFAGSLSRRGIKAVIAGAGGAAHLPGVIAAQTTVPVLGVPLAATPLAGFDSLLAIVQMPKGIPVATFAVGQAGAGNAALFAIAMLAQQQPKLAKKLAQFRVKQAAIVRAAKLP